jgi:hypothetical protein
MRTEVDALPPQVDRTRHPAYVRARLKDINLNVSLRELVSRRQARRTRADDADSHDLINERAVPDEARTLPSDPTGAIRA